MRKLLCLLAVGLCLPLALSAAEAAGKKSRDSLVVRGCTKVVLPFCTGITSGGTTYVLFGANPPLPLGAGVDIYGTKTGGVGPCFGTSVQVTSWKRNRLLCAL